MTNCHLLFYNYIGDIMFDKMSDADLVGLREYVSGFKDIESLTREIDTLIKKRKANKSNLNIRFNMDMFIRLKIFDPSEFKVIRDNNINNLQELIDCDLDSLVGITPSIKEGLSWVRSAYDMSSFEEDEEHHVK